MQSKIKTNKETNTEKAAEVSRLSATRKMNCQLGLHEDIAQYK